jgi:hypothetical protein
VQTGSLLGVFVLRIGDVPRTVSLCINAKQPRAECGIAMDERARGVAPPR